MRACNLVVFFCIYNIEYILLIGGFVFVFAVIERAMVGQLVFLWIGLCVRKGRKFLDTILLRPCHARLANKSKNECSHHHLDTTGV